MSTIVSPEATLEQAQELGLRPEEFEAIKVILGRTPNFTEMSIYSVMWSEHCSYKNSITWLKKLPKELCIIYDVSSSLQKNDSEKEIEFIIIS